MADLARPVAIDRVIANADQFKRRLAIGENVYATRRAWRWFTDKVDTVGAAQAGAAAAKSALVAGALAAPAVSANPLVWAGIMAPAAAVTPIGWVIAAALAGGGIYYGVSRLLFSGPDAYVDVIPKFLNEPVDMLGMKLLDLHAALAFRLAAADGHVADVERVAIRDHFHEEWGYEPAYLDYALPIIELDSAGEDIGRMAEALAAFHTASRDCAPELMQRELLAFLSEIAAADGIDAPGEAEAIAATRKVLAGSRALSLKQAGADLADWTGTMRDAAVEAGGTAREVVIGSARHLQTRASVIKNRLARRM